MNPRRQAAIFQQRRTRHLTSNADAYAFFNLLTGPELFEPIDSLLPDHRERLFPPTETLSMFMTQALSADRSCQRAVNELAIKQLRAGLKPCSTQTGGYCRARQRLPVEMVSSLVRRSGNLISGSSNQAGRWMGRPIRLVDGTTIAMPDTRANQAAYPQSRAKAWAWISDLPHGRHCLSFQRGGVGCGSRTFSRQGW